MDNMDVMHYFVTFAVMIFQVNSLKFNAKKPGLIYILKWTSPNKTPFNYLMVGQKAFKMRECTYKNCFVTDDRRYFKTVTDFNALLFNAQDMAPDEFTFPLKRTPDQHYVFVSTEPAAKYPIPTEFNNFFNHTWTYKLDSDVIFPFIMVKDMEGNTVGPSNNVAWINLGDVRPTEYLKYKLRNKAVAAAWFDSDCNKAGPNWKYVDLLQKRLNAFGHKLDIYDECGNSSCATFAEGECDSLIESDYYFYLVFENIHSQDYVTEKLLKPLQHFSVPIVYGAANYERFMPEGSFLDARLMKPQQLAKEITNSIKNRDKYYSYYKWFDYYTFHSTRGFGLVSEVCDLCALLNEDKTEQVYVDFVRWWNEPGDWIEGEDEIAANNKARKLNKPNANNQRKPKNKKIKSSQKGR